MLRAPGVWGILHVAQQQSGADVAVGCVTTLGQVLEPGCCTSVTCNSCSVCVDEPRDVTNSFSVF